MRQSYEKKQHKARKKRKKTHATRRKPTRKRKPETPDRQGKPPNPESPTEPKPAETTPHTAAGGRARARPPPRHAHGGKRGGKAGHGAPAKRTHHTQGKHTNTPPISKKDFWVVRLAALKGRGTKTRAPGWLILFFDSCRIRGWGFDLCLCWFSIGNIYSIRDLDR